MPPDTLLCAWNVQLLPLNEQKEMLEKSATAPLSGTAVRVTELFTGTKNSHSAKLWFDVNAQPGMDRKPGTLTSSCPPALPNSAAAMLTAGTNSTSTTPFWEMVKVHSGSGLRGHGELAPQRLNTFNPLVTTAMSSYAVRVTVEPTLNVVLHRGPSNEEPTMSHAIS